MSISISFRQKKNDKDEDLLLFPEMGSTPAEQTRGIEWLAQSDEGRLAVDVYETDSEIMVQAAIAGVEPEDLEVFVHNDMLTVRGKRIQQTEVSSDKYLTRECHWGAFSRSIILPVEVDAERIAATLKNGILTVRMPKIKRSKRIEIKEI